MKKFIIMSNKEFTKFTIHFSYKNAGCSPTKRTSLYHSLDDAKKAAKGFIERGYKLVNDLNDL